MWHRRGLSDKLSSDRAQPGPIKVFVSTVVLRVKRASMFTRLVAAVRRAVVPGLLPAPEVRPRYLVPFRSRACRRGLLRHRHHRAARLPRAVALRVSRGPGWLDALISS